MKNKIMRQFGSLAIALSLIFGINPAFADETIDPQNVATVETVVADVLKHNAELQLYENQISAARGELLTAGQWANPELSGTVGNKHVSGGGTSEDGTAWSISAQQTFEWPGRRALRKLIADKEIELAELALARFRLALASEARAATFDLLAAQEKADATAEVSGRYQSLRKVLSKRNTPGVNPLLERRIIEATAFGLSRKAVDAEIEVANARLRLNELLGAALNSNLQIQPTKFDFAAPPPLPTLIDAAKVQNFDLLMRQAELKRQSLKVDLARNERLPDLAVGPYFSEERAGEQERQIGVAVSVPLPVWNQNQGRIATEKARKAGAKTLLLVSERRVERKITESFEAYRLQLADLQQLDGLRIEDFKKAAALADEHYRLGAVPVATYIELQKQYLEAIETTLNLRREVLKAIQELEQLTGLDFNSANSSAAAYGAR